MPSAKSHLLYFVTRNRHLLQFRLKRQAWDWNTSIPRFRQECEESAKRAKMPDGIKVSPVTIADLPAGLSAEWIRPFTVTDLKLTGESHRTKAKVCLSPEGMATVCSRYYAGENDPGLPWISPLYGELDGLPPLLIYVGEDEIWLDDSTRFAAKAQAAGVDVTLRVGEGMMHGYPLLAPLFPEATQAMEEICAFIKMHT